MSISISSFRRAGAIVAGAAALTALAACGGTTRSSQSGSGSVAVASSSAGSAAAADPSAPVKEGLRIAYLPKQLNNPYSDIEAAGGKAAVTELKGVYKLVGPNDASASSQVSYINTLVQQGQDAIAIAANDPNAVCPSLNQARAKGIKVVTFDSDAAPTCRDLFFNQASTEGVGQGLAQLTNKLVGPEGGEIAVLSATANATNQNAWIAVLREELKKPEYAKLKLVKIAYGNDDDQKSFTEAQGLLQSYPRLRAVVAPTTVGISAAARYVSSSSYKGKVVVTGLGTPNQMRAFVKDGTVKAFALWNPADLGYLAGYGAAALASGRITGAEGEKFTAGKLGEYTIGKRGEVVLGPPTVFDSSNIDTFDF